MQTIEIKSEIGHAATGGRRSFYIKMYMVYVAIGLLIGLGILSIKHTAPAQISEHVAARAFTRQDAVICANSNECGNGICIDNTCRCTRGFTSINGICDYEQRSGLAALLISIFVGSLGIDWFYLYNNGNGAYIVAGIFKLLTAGGCGIWWLVDIIRIAVGVFLDGNGIGLTPI